MTDISHKKDEKKSHHTSKKQPTEKDIAKVDLNTNQSSVKHNNSNNKEKNIIKKEEIEKKYNKLKKKFRHLREEYSKVLENWELGSKTIRQLIEERK